MNAQQQMKFGAFGGAPAPGYGAAYQKGPGAVLACMAAPIGPPGMACPVGFGLSRNQVPEQAVYQSKRLINAQVPVLGFVKNSAVLLAGLEPGSGGSVVWPAEQLQQLLQEATSTAAGHAESSSSSSSSVFGPGGFTVVYVAAYIPKQPGQFSSSFAAIEGAAGPEASVQPDARRDLGLTTDIDDTAIHALVSNCVSCDYRVSGVRTKCGCFVVPISSTFSSRVPPKNPCILVVVRYDVAAATAALLATLCCALGCWCGTNLFPTKRTLHLSISHSFATYVDASFASAEAQLA